MTSWREIDEALGLVGPDPELVEAFKAAGFDEAAAVRGSKMMASGRYFGFTDVATSLATAGGRAMSPIQETKIAEAARRVEEAAAARNRTRTSPWGRPAETGDGPGIADFKAVGLSEAGASCAAAGLANGTYISFEDACLSTAMSGNGRHSLNEAAMREKAKQFAQGR